MDLSCKMTRIYYQNFFFFPVLQIVENLKGLGDGMDVPNDMIEPNGES